MNRMKKTPWKEWRSHFFSFDKVDLVVLLYIKANKWCHDIQSKKTYGMVQNLCSQSCTGRSRSQKQKQSLTFALFSPSFPQKHSHMSCLCRFLPCRMWNHLTFCMGNINRLVLPFYWKIMADTRFFFFQYLIYLL